MATDRDFVDYVAEQAGLGERLTTRRMFGEYGLYVDGIVVAFCADNSLFLKRVAETAALLDDLPGDLLTRSWSSNRLMDASIRTIRRRSSSKPPCGMMVWATFGLSGHAEGGGEVHAGSAS